MGKIVRVIPFKIFFLFLFVNTLLFSTTNILTKVEVVKGELRVHFKNECSKKQIRQFTLSKPYRKVFDFRNTRLADGVGKNLGSSLRVAQFKPNIVRIVISSEKPYSCTAYKPIFTQTKYHIPLPKNMTTAPATRYKKPKVDIKVTEAYVAKKNTVQKKLKVPNVKEKKQSLYQRRKDLIVIDAGHGGHDSGASCGGKKEKHLALTISKKVAKELKKRGYLVHLTRTTNRFLKLSQRTHIADKKGAAAFVSIHANSVPKKYKHRVHGVETYFLQNTRDARSQRIASRENAAVLKGAGTKLSKRVIVDSVLNGPKIVQSNKLAIDVQRRIITNLRSKYKGVKDGGVRHAPFYVLVGASRPSILVEVGYMSHTKERKRLFTSRYQNLIAKGIAEGIDNYLNNRKKEIDF